MWPELWLQTSVYGPSFGNDFMNLTSMDEVQNRRTIRVILLCCNRPSHLLFMKTPPACLVVVSTWTYYLHQNQTQSAQRHFGLVPSVFLGFALMQNSNLREPSLEGLVQEIVRYRVYVTDKQFDTVGKALISKHPFLTERGSLT